jgi:hypothetical protein
MNYNNTFLFDPRLAKALKDAGKTDDEVNDYIEMNLVNEVKINAYRDKDNNIIYVETDNLYPSRMTKRQVEKMKSFLKEKEYEIYSVTRLDTGIIFKIDDEVKLDSQVIGGASRIKSFEFTFDTFWLSFGSGGNSIFTYNSVIPANYVLYTQDKRYKLGKDYCYVVSMEEKRIDFNGVEDILKTVASGKKVLAFDSKEKAKGYVIENYVGLTLLDYRKAKFSEVEIAKIISYQFRGM